MFSIYLILLYIVMLAIKPTRKLALALTPWLLFGCCYDVMRLMPNYEVNGVDVKDLYEAEKQFFGIASTNGATLIPGEWFQLHYSTPADILAGLFYLCWVPVPICFALWLFLKKDYKTYLHFSIAFLLVNLIGFCGYYIHPAAPPWYAINYGFEAVPGTPGNVAGLGRFDEIVGVGIFQSLYGKNSNVFAAVPSLHAAYMLIATVYAIISRQKKATIIIFGIICAGIWWTAVYSTHHYIIDIILGIITAIIGILLLEKVILNNKKGKLFIDKYVEAIRS